MAEPHVGDHVSYYKGNPLITEADDAKYWATKAQEYANAAAGSAAAADTSAKLAEYWANEASKYRFDTAANWTMTGLWRFDRALGGVGGVIARFTDENNYGASVYQNGANTWSLRPITAGVQDFTVGFEFNFGEQEWRVRTPLRGEEPTQDYHLATKLYVDSQLAAGFDPTVSWDITGTWSFNKVLTNWFTDDASNYNIQRWIDGVNNKGLVIYKTANLTEIGFAPWDTGGVPIASALRYNYALDQWRTGDMRVNDFICGTLLSETDLNGVTVQDTEGGADGFTIRDRANMLQFWDEGAGQMAIMEGNKDLWLMNAPMTFMSGITRWQTQTERAIRITVPTTNLSELEWILADTTRVGRLSMDEGASTLRMIGSSGRGLALQTNGIDRFTVDGTTGAMTAVAALTVPAPTLAGHAATKQYVDDNAGGGAVDSVFGRTGAVIAQSGDYAAFYDALGAAAAVQTNLDNHTAAANHAYLDAVQEWTLAQTFATRFSVKNVNATPASITQPRIVVADAEPTPGDYEEGDLWVS